MKLVDNSKVKKPIDRVEQLEKTVEQLATGVRVSQMLIKNLMEQISKQDSAIRSATSMLNDFQYRLLALQHLTVDKDKLTKLADELKLSDWQDASAKDDRESGLEPVEKVEFDTDVVIITSTTPELPEDQGIFRSKLPLVETGSTELISALMGKNVGETVEVKLGENTHKVTLLGVRRKSKVEEKPVQ